jgi:hypothetical protein
MEAEMEMQLRERNRTGIFAVALFVIVTISMLAGCKRDTGGAAAPAPEPSSSTPISQATPLSPFERDLQYVRNGQYTHIWIFSRKDQHALDKDDAAYLRTNAPQVVDWVTTDEGKKVIGGTNFDLEQGNLALLKKRFVVEDYTGK